ncbi:MAG: cupin domain-containing protein [Gammaproteobacteria bacterium]|jgi:quercetin dioxygenase-like cupin family protein|nr:cupin domain-containing protein [Gammaproteobacteria bacterium]
MNRLKNLPSASTQNLASLIDAKAQQVVSMALSSSDTVQVSLFTFADGEMVSEESYPGDTFYLLVEGETKITLGDREIPMVAGDILAVEADRLHAIGGGTGFKVLQVTIHA